MDTRKRFVCPHCGNDERFELDRVILSGGIVVRNEQVDWSKCRSVQVPDNDIMTCSVCGYTDRVSRFARVSPDDRLAELFEDIDRADRARKVRMDHARRHELAEHDLAVGFLSEEVGTASRLLEISRKLDVLRDFYLRDPYFITRVKTDEVGIIRYKTGCGTCISGIGLRSSDSTAMAILPEQSYIYGTSESKHVDAGIYLFDWHVTECLHPLGDPPEDVCDRTSSEANRYRRETAEMKRLEMLLPAFERDYWAYADRLAKGM